MTPVPKTPPRYVPTLTDVVVAKPASNTQPSAPAPASPTRDIAVLQEQLVQRVLQRVDASLEVRLRNAVATLVLEQTRDLGPLLRKEIEGVVRASVVDALADELAAVGASQAPVAPSY